MRHYTVDKKQNVGWSAISALKKKAARLVTIFGCVQWVCTPNTMKNFLCHLVFLALYVHVAYFSSRSRKSTGSCYDTFDFLCHAQNDQ